VESWFASWCVQELITYPKAPLPYPDFRSVDSEAFTPGLSGWGVSLAIHLHLVSKLRMSEAIPPFPSYAVMTCTGTAVASCTCDANGTQYRHYMKSWYFQAVVMGSDLL
jgi:hypothetical protein